MAAFRQVTVWRLPSVVPCSETGSWYVFECRLNRLPTSLGGRVEPSGTCGRSRIVRGRCREGVVGMARASSLVSSGSMETMGRQLFMRLAR